MPEWRFIRAMYVAYTLMILFAIFIDFQRRDWGGVIAKLFGWGMASFAIWWSKRQQKRRDDEVS